MNFKPTPTMEEHNTLREKLAAAEKALGKCTGMFAAAGGCEPLEGFAERPQDLERAIRDVVELKAAAEKRADEAEASAINVEWQDKIRGIFIHHGVPDNFIDGAGSDGDEFAFTEAEVSLGCVWFVDQLDEAKAKNAALESRVAELEGALKWYATDANYGAGSVSSESPSVMQDCGRIASEALANSIPASLREEE